MTKNEYDKIFNSTMDEFNKNHSISKSIEKYLDSDGNIDIENAITFAYSESFNDSCEFIHQLLKNILVYE